MSLDFNTTFQEHLREARVPDSELEWMSELLLADGVLSPHLRDPAVGPGSEHDHVFETAQRLGYPFSSNLDSLETAYLKVLSYLYGKGLDHIRGEDNGVWSVSSSTWDTICRRFLERKDLEFNRFGPLSKIEWSPKDGDNHIKQDRFMQRLCDSGIVNPVAVIDLDLIYQDQTKRSVLVSDVSRLQYWLRVLDTDALELVLPVFAQVSDDRIATLANALKLEIEGHFEYLNVYHRRGATPRDGERWSSLASSLKGYARELGSRVESNPDDMELRSMWYFFARHAWTQSPEELPANTRRLLLESARRELGLVRPLLRNAKDRADTEDILKDRIRCLDNALHVIVSYDSLWSSIKLLLQALRALSVPSVNASLRYWPEQQDSETSQPPKVFSWIPSLTSGFLHTYLRFEQAQDSQLEVFRSEFANFCIERLKTRKGASRVQRDTTSDDLVEVHPIWRECYIRAYQELGANPKGKGHHVLHWSRQNDPSGDVRKAASIAYRQARKGKPLQEGVSPRRCIFAAMWWLRQAHMRALGEQVHDQQAQRTRRKEVQHTRELETRERRA